MLDAKILGKALFEPGDRCAGSEHRAAQDLREGRQLGFAQIVMKKRDRSVWHLGKFRKAGISVFQANGVSAPEKAQAALRVGVAAMYVVPFTSRIQSCLRHQLTLPMYQLIVFSSPSSKETVGVQPSSRSALLASAVCRKTWPGRSPI